MNNDSQTARKFLFYTMYFLFGFIITALIITSCGGCGYQQTLRAHCRIGDTQTCDALFGVNQFDIDENQNKDIENLSKEITSIKTQLDANINAVLLMQSQYKTSQTLLSILQLQLYDNSASIELLKEQLADLNSSIEYQNVVINDMQITLSNISSQDTIVQYIDPCGDKPGTFDEILMQTKSGNFIAYFESGSKRYLTTLQKNVNYVTTDGSACHFTINSSGELVNEHY